MAEEDDSQKTEEPTEKRKSKAREKGQVASSQEVKNWAILLGGAIGLMMMAPKISRDVTLIGRRFIESPEAIPFNLEHLRLVVADVYMDVGWSLAPLFGLLLLLGIAANLAQSGLIWSWEKPKPKFSNISMLKGFKQKFSMKNFVEFLKGLFKIGLVSIASFMVAIPLVQDITLFPSFSLASILDRFEEIAFVLVLASLAIMLVIAVLDFSFQKYQHIKQMRMTKQEVKDEHKDQEGDPQVKARIRKIRAERAQQRMMAAVPEADVVITNPTHFAVALKYDMGMMGAPTLVAKGVDTLAFKIREVAEEAEVPIVENPPLARALYATVELDEEIPAEHYVAVAEVIGYVMRLKGKLPH